ncbi:hypothetical protein [Spirochaeta dissipatitropha]
MLTATQMADKLKLESMYEPYEDTEIAAGFTSDLLSDIMGNCPDDAALISIQAHTNTVAVATLVGAAAILIASGRPIPEEMIAAARAEEIPLFRTELNQFQISCALGALL